MLNKFEKKVDEKISINIENKRKLKKEYDINLNQEIIIRSLLENLKIIKETKKKKNILSILIVIFGIASIMTPFSLILFILGIIGYKIDEKRINDNFQEIINSDYIGSKNEKDLNKELYNTLYKNCIIEDKIKNNNNRINEYNRIKTKINYIKELKNNDNYCKQLEEVYQTIPVLAFNSLEEYKNYLSYDDEFIKNEIIKSKILTKHIH